MIAYHIDRDNSLHQGQTIQLYEIPNNSSLLLEYMFNNKLSNHGLHYINESLQNVGDNRPAFYALEYELELIRRAYFPQMPSRYQVMFAIDSLDKVYEWNDLFGCNYSIWKIEFPEENHIIRDSNLLYVPVQEQDGKQIFCQHKSFCNAYKYWNGELSDNPRMEVLIKPPVKVIEKIELL